MGKKKTERPDGEDSIEQDASAPEAGVTEETVRQIVVEQEQDEPTDEDIIKAMTDSACAIREGVGLHDRCGVEARARELLAMLRAFQELYRGR